VVRKLLKLNSSRTLGGNLPLMCGALAPNWSPTGPQLAWDWATLGRYFCRQRW